MKVYDTDYEVKSYNRDIHIEREDGYYLINLYYDDFDGYTLRWHKDGTHIPQPEWAKEMEAEYGGDHIGFILEEMIREQEEVRV